MRFYTRQHKHYCGIDLHYMFGAAPGCDQQPKSSQPQIVWL